MDNDEKLREHLQRLGKVKIRDYYFGEGVVRYKTIELITRRNVAESLEKKLDFYFSEQNGFGAIFEFEEVSVEDRNTFKYVIRIRPLEDVPVNKYGEVTRKVLESLPHVIKSFVKMYKRV